MESWSKSRKQPKLAEPHRTTETVEFKHGDKIWARFLRKVVLLFFSFIQLISKERPGRGKKNLQPSPNLPVLGRTSIIYFHSNCTLQNSRPARSGKIPTSTRLLEAFQKEIRFLATKPTNSQSPGQGNRLASAFTDRK